MTSKIEEWRSVLGLFTKKNNLKQKQISILNKLYVFAGEM